MSNQVTFEEYFGIAGGMGTAHNGKQGLTDTIGAGGTVSLRLQQYNDDDELVTIFQGDLSQDGGYGTVQETDDYLGNSTSKNWKVGNGPAWVAGQAGRIVVKRTNGGSEKFYINFSESSCLPRILNLSLRTGGSDLFVVYTWKN